MKFCAKCRVEKVLAVIDFLFWIATILSLFFLKMQENILEFADVRLAQRNRYYLIDLRNVLLTLAIVFTSMTLLFGMCSLVLALKEKRKGDRLFSSIAKMTGGVFLFAFTMVLVV